MEATQAIAYLRLLDRSGYIVLPAQKAESCMSAEDALDVVEEATVPAGELIAEAKLEALASEVADCRKCGLCEGRTKTVPGEGSPDAKIVFVGEAPGYHEDKQGRPFVGKAGALLTKMIQAIGFEREEVFICNVIKCRPPNNRDPQPEEVAACESYLLRQLEIIKPTFIIALGRYAAQCLLATKTPISKLRGNWREYHGIRLMPTFHPAYLERNPADKRLCWQDLQMVMREYERLVGPLPRSRS